MHNITNSEEKLNFENVLETLEKKGSSFAIATVIRTMSSTAAKPGMKAIISNKGEILSGWLGGGCVTNAVWCKFWGANPPRRTRYHVVPYELPLAGT